MSPLFSVKTPPLLKAAWVVVPMVLIGWTAYLTFESQKTLTGLQADFTRAVDVRGRLRIVYISIIDAETGQRGFLLTSREAYLAPYSRAVNELPGEIDHLRNLYAWSPDQYRSVDELGVLLKDKLEEMGQTLRLSKDGDMAAALRLVNSDRGKRSMDRMRALIAQMISRSESTLAEREAAYTDQSRSHTRLAVLLVIANGAFVAIVATLLWRVKRMEQLVTICAWSKAIEYEGEWISFEEYLKRRFGLETTHGISPEESEKFRKAVEQTASPPL